MKYCNFSMNVHFQNRKHLIKVLIRKRPMNTESSTMAQVCPLLRVIHHSLFPFHASVCALYQMEAGNALKITSKRADVLCLGCSVNQLYAQY